MIFNTSIFRRGRSLSAICATLLLSLSTANTVYADSVSDSAATWLIAQQLVGGTGAFPWTPGGAATRNTQGASALGLLRAYERSGTEAQLLAAIATGDCLLAGNTCIADLEFSDGHHRFTTHDMLFLEQLSIDSQDPQYAQFVEDEFWSRLNAGTYGETTDWDAADYANYVLTARTNQGYADLVAWDLSKAAIAAHVAGEIATRDAFMAVILASLDASDASFTTFDVIGLTGAVWASAVTGVDLDPTSGKWAAATDTTDLAIKLLDYQAPSGGFVGNTVVSVDDSEAESQATSFAMQALAAVDRSVFANDIALGFSFITSLQLVSGEFLGYQGAAPGSTGAVETHGETLEAYASIVLRPQDIYVDDDFAGSGFGNLESFSHPQINGGTAFDVIFGQNAFATITDALANVAIGGNVYVTDGTYVEGDATAELNLFIEHPVNLVGAQATIDGRNRSDTGASIIQPDYANASLDYASQGSQVIVLIDSDGVSLDGFVLDGDNPALSSGVVMGTADPDVDAGVYATGSNIAISNNVIRNLVYAGIYNYNYPAIVPAGSGNVISNNWIYNIDAPSDWGIGIALLWNFYADVSDNLLEDVRVGIQTNYNFKPTANPSTDARIIDNEVHASAVGIYHNYQDGLGADIASPYTISDNDIFATNNAAQSGNWQGFIFQTLNKSTTAFVTNNNIDGSALAGSGRNTMGYRIGLINTTLASSTEITGGSVSSVDYGVLASDGAFYSGALTDLNVGGIAFSDVSMAAFYVEDTALAGSETTDNFPKLTILGGNSYNNVAYEAALAGPNATIALGNAAPLFNTVLVRAANGGHREGLANSNGDVRQVENAIINAGIALAAVAGTVDVEAGTFDQNVLVNKSVNLRGAQHGIAGFDGARDGTGETMLSPNSGSAFSLAANQAIVDGFSISMASGVAVKNGGGSNRDNMQFINNRVVDIADGAGIRFEPGEGNPASGLIIANNLFSNVQGTVGTGKAIELYKGSRDSQITNNHFDSISNVAVQVNGGNGSVLHTEIAGNTVSDSLAVGAGTAFVTTNVTGMLVTDNVVTDAALGLFISDAVSDLEFSCNSVDGANRGFSSSTYFGETLNTDVQIFHNAITNTVTTDVNNGMGQPLVVGSNWYGGAIPVTTGSDVFVADALPATPIGEAACGDNTATQIVAFAGSGQNATINDAFGDDLQARVVDALGGAVMSQTVNFSAPASGASAILGSASGDTDYNGVVSTTATANDTAGSYDVTATSGSLTPDASFALTNDKANITIDLVLGTLNKIYNGQQHVVTATASVPSVSYTITYDGSPTAPTEAGSYAVVATIDSANYTGTISGTLVIAPADATISLADQIYIYDGLPKIATVTTTPAGLNVVITYDGSTTAPTAVGTYAVVVDLYETNYAATTVNATLEIRLDGIFSDSFETP